jgi:hypothetical protein
MITDSRNGITKARIQIDAALVQLLSQATATPTVTSTPVATATPTVTSTPTATPTIPTTQTPIPTPTTQPGGAPTVYINYLDGAPGSSFLVEGFNFPPGVTLELRINDVLVSNAITTDQDGRFTLLLATLPEAETGYYEIVVSEQGSPYPYPTPVPYPAPSGLGTVTSTTSGKSGYQLLATASLREVPVGAPAPLEVPPSISTTRYIFLPAVQR